MTVRYVLDGSNLAHDGPTSSPSFDRLMKAGESLHAEHPGDDITICVDASLYNQLSSKDRIAYAEADRNRIIWTAPAGTVGKGDTWIVAVAETAMAHGQEVVVVSNDSFAELQSEHDWIFDADRMLGGHMVDGVGWVWVKRFPVDKRGKLTSSTPSLKLVTVQPPTDAELASPDEPVLADSQVVSDLDLTPELVPGEGSIIECVVTGTKGYCLFVMGDRKYRGRISRDSFPDGYKTVNVPDHFSIGVSVFAELKALVDNGNLRLSYQEALAVPGPGDAELQRYGLRPFQDNDDEDAYAASLKVAQEKRERHMNWLLSDPPFSSQMRPEQDSPTTGDSA